MKPSKVVYNSCYGGYGLSKEAVALYTKIGGECEAGRYGDLGISRHDPLLVSVVEQLGEKANGDHAKLNIFELRGRAYQITEYDGLEQVVEPANVRWIVID